MPLRAAPLPPPSLRGSPIERPHGCLASPPGSSIGVPYGASPPPDVPPPAHSAAAAPRPCERHRAAVFLAGASPPRSAVVNAAPFLRLGAPLGGGCDPPGAGKASSTPLPPPTPPCIFLWQPPPRREEEEGGSEAMGSDEDTAPLEERMRPSRPTPPPAVLPVPTFPPPPSPPRDPPVPIRPIRAIDPSPITRAVGLEPRVSPIGGNATKGTKLGVAIWSWGAGVGGHLWARVSLWPFSLRQDPRFPPARPPPPPGPPQRYGDGGGSRGEERTPRLLPGGCCGAAGRLPQTPVPDGGRGGNLGILGVGGGLKQERCGEGAAQKEGSGDGGRGSGVAVVTGRNGGGGRL